MQVGAGRERKGGQSVVPQREDTCANRSTKMALAMRNTGGHQHCMNNEGRRKSLSLSLSLSVIPKSLFTHVLPAACR